MFDRQEFSDLTSIIENELTHAIEDHGLFRSRHEAWAVLREEVMEARSEMFETDVSLSKLDEMVRYDESTDYAELKSLYRHARFLAMEAVQVAAMALKWTRGIENEKHTSGSE